MSREIIPNSLIGEGAEFKGKFKVAGSFRIDGHFEGELTVEDHLFISPIGKLKTDTVYTKTIAIAGIFMGNVDASEEVQLLSTGRVLGNIKSPRLVMEPGVVVQGSIDITGSKSQQLDTIVADSFNGQNENIIVTDKIHEITKQTENTDIEDQKDPEEFFEKELGSKSSKDKKK